MCEGRCASPYPWPVRTLPPASPGRSSLRATNSHSDQPATLADEHPRSLPHCDRIAELESRELDQPTVLTPAEKIAVLGTA